MYCLVWDVPCIVCVYMWVATQLQLNISYHIIYWIYVTFSRWHKTYVIIWRWCTPQSSCTYRWATSVSRTAVSMTAPMANHQVWHSKLLRPSHSILLCFVWISEQISITSLYCINRLVRRKVRKTAKSDHSIRHVSIRTCVWPSALNNSAPTRRIFMKFGEYFKKICRENSNSIKIRRIMRTLHEERGEFLLE
jgi:hypothetical protein